MRITCPHCGFTNEVDAALIPANVVRVTCPDCRQPFPLSVEQTADVTPATVSDDVDPIEEESTVDNEPSSITTDAPGQEEPETTENLTFNAEQESATIESTDNEQTEPARGEPVEPACGEPVEPATITARYAAMLIDGMLIMIMVMIVRAGVNMLGNTIQLEGQLILGSVFMLFALSLGFAYHTLFVGICGQTPGKMLLHIRVVTDNCSDVTYRQAMLREVLGKTLSLPLFLGYLMALFNPRHLAAHDKIADTCVVKLITTAPVE